MTSVTLTDSAYSRSGKAVVRGEYETEDEEPEDEDGLVILISSEYVNK